MTIYFIRHAEGRHNEAGDYDNERYVDATLSTRGREQALALRAVEEVRTPDVVIHSPLRRAFQTAALAFPESSLEADPLCRERVKFRCDLLPGENPFRENDNTVRERAARFLEKLRTLDTLDPDEGGRGRKIAVVTHGGFINAIKGLIEGGEPRSKYYRNAEILRVQGGVVVSIHNDGSSRRTRNPGQGHPQRLAPPQSGGGATPLSIPPQGSEEDPEGGHPKSLPLPGGVLRSSITSTNEGILG